MEYAEEHEKSENDLNLVFQRGKGGVKKRNEIANESKNQFSCLLAMHFARQNNRKFASAIKLLCWKTQRSHRTWNSRTRKLCSAKPLREYLIENESE